VTTPPVRVERRVGQRFLYNTSVSLRECSGEIQGAGFTQDLSSRGAFLFTDAPLSEGSEIELTLRMPSEITLGENMRVRCRGRVLRVARPAAPVAQKTTSQHLSDPRLGVAVRFDSYEYLPDLLESNARTARAAALHRHEEEPTPTQPAGTRSFQG
jgi:PilZ domain